MELGLHLLLVVLVFLGKVTGGQVTADGRVLGDGGLFQGQFAEGVRVLIVADGLVCPGEKMEVVPGCRIA